ncbi:hypothetical protein CEXT_290881 [Caerostris extrusa]|uniref:Uncharacterized protein n=1 Tax=Caerostris extrusa TaxID=172846 RepID=A0AAV4XLS9_CAEEX|nr:hypothetical protein CEXT_290881 [Caerostris extrusa]
MNSSSVLVNDPIEISIRFIDDISIYIYIYSLCWGRKEGVNPSYTDLRNDSSKLQCYQEAHIYCGNGNHACTISTNKWDNLNNLNLNNLIWDLFRRNPPVFQKGTLHRIETALQLRIAGRLRKRAPPTKHCPLLMFLSSPPSFPALVTSQTGRPRPNGGRSTANRYAVTHDNSAAEQGGQTPVSAYPNTHGECVCLCWRSCSYQVVFERVGGP